MTEISIKAELSQIYTNHCIQATFITDLDDIVVEVRSIMNVSGHKSETSINSYSRNFLEEKTMKCALCYKTKASARFDTFKVEDTDNQLQLRPNNRMLDPMGSESGPILE